MHLSQKSVMLLNKAARQDHKLRIELLTAYMQAKVAKQTHGCQADAHLIVLVSVDVVTLFWVDFDSCAADDSTHTLKQLRLQAVRLGDVCHYELKAAAWGCLQVALHVASMLRLNVKTIVA